MDYKLGPQKIRISPDRAAFLKTEETRRKWLSQTDLAAAISIVNKKKVQIIQEELAP